MTTFVVSPAKEDGRMSAVAYETREAATAAATPNDYVIGFTGDVIWTGSVLVEVHNALTRGKPVKKFESREVGARRLLSVLAEVATPAPTQTQENKTVAKTQTAESGKRRGKAPNTSQFAQTDVITVVAAENPKKVGSKTYDKFAQLQTGMTVEGARQIGYSTHDLTWERDHGYISIAPAA